MPELRRVSGKEAIRGLERPGFEQVRQRGSYVILKKWAAEGEVGCVVLLHRELAIGTLPGTTISDAVGIGKLGRMVGWSTTQNFPPNRSPYVWTESGGMVDLSAQGYPDERPLAVSPGGAVATPGYWTSSETPAASSRCRLHRRASLRRGPTRRRLTMPAMS